MARGRGFQEISVTRLGYQTARQRFGAHSRVHNPVTDDSESDDEDEEETPHAIPRVEEWRMNLTALSQYHNLYFAAYGGKIYVYKPQGSQQVLPTAPVFILEPPQSSEALHAITHQNRSSAHVINHIILGNLGNKEILLCSYDDGDVVAYYTDAIEDARQVNTANQSIPITPFFAEYAGNSAWGLAIHQQSRLIAVGTNSHEVQVFAFALTPPESQRLGCKRHARVLYECHVRFPHIPQSSIPRALDGQVVRQRGFRLIFRLPTIGHNIPAVSFSDDERAETIVAKDIWGALWFYRIWESKWMRLPTIAEKPVPNTQPMWGWGVIVIPRNFFKPTYTTAETYGHSRASATYSPAKVDISKSIQHVRDSTIWHEDFDDSDDWEYTEGDDKESDEEAEDSEMAVHADVLISETNVSTEPHREDPDSIMAIIDDESTNLPFMTPPAEISAPLAALRPPLEIWPQSCEYDEAIQGSTGFILTTKRSFSHLLTSGSTILHTNRHSITLLPSSDPCQPTHCDNALRQDFPHDAWFPRPLAEYDRLNMILTVPELSLVLVASQVGRVALLTITRTADRIGMLTGTVAMRVDLILPFSYEESAEKVRPNCGLLGMAVGPLVRGRGRGRITGGKRASRVDEMMGGVVGVGKGEGDRDIDVEGEGKGGTHPPRESRAEEETRPQARRWRLLLHYYDHTLLAYELSRDEETDELMVL